MLNLDNAGKREREWVRGREIYEVWNGKTYSHVKKNHYQIQ